MIINVCILPFILVQAQPQCVQDFDCLNPEICHQGSCIDACRLTACGTNAKCTSANHRGTCECLHGYEGNPTSGCFPCKSNLKLKMLYKC